MTKELRALQAIGYMFPVDKKQLVYTLEQLSFDHLSQMKAVYKHEYQFGLARMENLLASVIFSTCDICEKEQSGYNDLPKGWNYCRTEVQDYLMCDVCQAKYEKKWGQKPKIVGQI